MLAAGAEKRGDALEQVVDWLARMCGDAADDANFRVIAGHSLLDFPRERHRSVMEALVDLQQPGTRIANAYDRDDVERAFAVGDDPEWQRFGNPWQFYDPDEIDRRQERWLREAEGHQPDAYGAIVPSEPYQRPAPKVGRNDPCPCGSGKKYKKCCLNASYRGSTA